MRALIIIAFPIAAALCLLPGTADAQSCASDSTYHQPAPASNGHYNVSHHRFDGGERLVRRTVRRIMRRADLDGDGWISHREAHHSRELVDHFHRIDRNRDGYIGRQELDRHVRGLQRRSARVRYSRY